MNPQSFKNPTHLVFSFLLRFKKQLLVLFILWLIAAGLATAQPLIMAPMMQVALGETILGPATGSVSLANVDLNNVDRLVSNLLDLQTRQPWDVVVLLAGLFLIVVIVGALIETLAFYVFTGVRVNTLRNLQEFIFQHLLSLSMDYFNKQRSGELVSRLEQDAAASVNNLTNSLKFVSVAPVMVVVYGVMLVRTNLELMVLVTLIAAAQWTIARLLRGQIRKYVTAEFDLIAMVHAYLTEVFQNIRVVKSFAAEKNEQERLEKHFEGMIPIHIKRALSRHWQEPLVTMVNAIGSVLILLLAARELLNGSLTVVGFFLFLYVGRAIIQPISQIAQVYIMFQEMSASATRVFSILGLHSTISDGSTIVSRFDSEISFKDVSFAYADKPVLSNINVSIKRGETVALVGPSGAGKSTFTDLLLRFYDPTSGSISVDGVNLKEVVISSYRRLFGVVAQESLLFNETIANNITYGRNNLNMQQIQTAARIANAADFIDEMPTKYETFLGDRGTRVSGGQRQRIAIARAVVHQPEILILDEATSSLDTESERMVQTAIDRAVEGRTSVVIAHRLSTVIHADKIIVMESGHVIDQGKHRELIKRCPLYKRLCELQFQTGAGETAAAIKPAVEEFSQ